MIHYSYIMTNADFVFAWCSYN